MWPPYQLTRQLYDYQINYLISYMNTVSTSSISYMNTPGGCTPISDLYGYVRPQTPHYLLWPVPKPPTIYPDPFAEPPSFYPCPFEVHTKYTGTRSFTVNCEIIYL